MAEFDGTTVDGEPVGRGLLTGDTLFAFVMVGCAPCQAALPGLVDTAGRWPGGRSETLVVIAGTDEDSAEYVEALSPIAKVVVDGRGGPIVAAFGVEGFPAFGVVDASGTLLRSERDPAALLPAAFAV